MKECFIPRRFTPEVQLIIDQAIEELERYDRMGIVLMSRSLFYRFISMDWFPDSWVDREYNLKKGLDPDTKNTLKNYKRLGSILTDARLAGQIDWDLMEDRGRTIIRNPHWKGPKHFLESVIPQYSIDKWIFCRNYIEVMVEKQSLEATLESICKKLDVTFCSNKGYSSAPALKLAGERFETKITQDKNCHLIYLGDHDPSGLDMTRDLEERVNMFAHSENHGVQVQVHRIALNIDQVKKYRLPNNPSKSSDSRTPAYTKKFGKHCWELDGLDAQVLANMVEAAVVSLREPEMSEKALKLESKQQRELLKFVRTSPFKS